MIPNARSSLLESPKFKDWSFRVGTLIWLCGLCRSGGSERFRQTEFNWQTPGRQKEPTVSTVSAKKPTFSCFCQTGLWGYERMREVQAGCRNRKKADYSVVLHPPRRSVWVTLATADTSGWYDEMNKCALPSYSNSCQYVHVGWLINRSVYVKSCSLMLAWSLHPVTCGRVRALAHGKLHVVSQSYPGVCVCVPCSRTDKTEI